MSGTRRANLRVCDTCSQILSISLLQGQRLQFCCPECAHEWSTKILEQSSSIAEAKLRNTALALAEALLTGRGIAVFNSQLVSCAAAVSTHVRCIQHEVDCGIGRLAISLSPVEVLAISKLEVEERVQEESSFDFSCAESSEAVDREP